MKYKFIDLPNLIRLREHQINEFPDAPIRQNLQPDNF